MRSRGALNADCLRVERLAAGCSLLGFSTLTDVQPHALLFGCTKQSDCMHASALRCTIGHLSSTPQTVHVVQFGVNIPADTMTHWLPADSQNNSYYKEFQIENTWTGFFKIWRIYLVKLIRFGGQNWLHTATDCKTTGSYWNHFRICMLKIFETIKNKHLLSRSQVGLFNAHL